MRANKEKLQGARGRAAETRRVQRRRQTIWLGGGAAMCALALILLLAVRMPAVTERLIPVSGKAMQASILTDSGLLGYAVIGMVAFLLGVAVTVFCDLLRRGAADEEKHHDRDR